MGKVWMGSGRRLASLSVGNAPLRARARGIVFLTGGQGRREVVKGSRPRGDARGPVRDWDARASDEDGGGGWEADANFQRIGCERIPYPWIPPTVMDPEWVSRISQFQPRGQPGMGRRCEMNEDSSFWGEGRMGRRGSEGVSERVGANQSQTDGLLPIAWLACRACPLTLLPSCPASGIWWMRGSASPPRLQRKSDQPGPTSHFFDTCANVSKI